MTDIKQIETEMLQAGPGTVIEITGYRDSSGEVKDMRVELLPLEAYTTMLSEDLIILRAADAQLLKADDLNMVDIIAARSQLIASRENSLQQRATGSPLQGGAKYDELTPSLARMPGDEGALYLCRMQSRRVPATPKPAKGAVPRAKQMLIKDLNLPTSWYIHTLKLEDGKFEDLQILQFVPRQVPQF